MSEEAINLATLAAHPVATLFPLLKGEARAALVADVRKAGRVYEPVWLIRGEGGVLLVLDGRNRIAGALEAGVPQPEYRIFEGDVAAAVAFVLSKNLARRHLNESQRALAVAKVRVKLGSKSKYAALHKNCPPIPQAEAAIIAGVSPRLMADAVKVLRYGTPEALAAIEAGETTVTNVALGIKLAAFVSRKTAKMEADQAAHDLALEKAPEADQDTADDDETVEGVEVAEPVAADADAPPKAAAHAEAEDLDVNADAAAAANPSPAMRTGNPAKPKKAKAEPKVTAEQRDEENRKLAFKQEAIARDTRDGREAGNKALAIIAAHMPGDAIESLHAPMRDKAQGGGWHHFLSGLFALKPSRQGNGVENLAAENERLRCQVALLQGDASGIAIDPESPARNIADQMRAALGEDKASLLGQILLGNEDADHRDAAE